MQNFDFIEKIWNDHSVEAKISSDEMLAQVKKDVGTLKNKSFVNIILMVGCIIVLCVLWYFLTFSSITTNIGLGITILSILVYSVLLYKDHVLINKTDFTAYPAEYLTYLKQYQINRYKLYNSTYWIYVISLTVGIALYFIEILQYFSIEWRWLAIILTFGWILFCSTYVRKIVMRREKERIETLIEKLERLSAQFKS